jgi:hypothetical protein
MGWRVDKWADQLKWMTDGYYPMTDKAPLPSNPPDVVYALRTLSFAWAQHAADEIERLREVVYWALGERDEFPEEPELLAGKYKRRFYWRTELRRRAFGTADETPQPASNPLRSALIKRIYAICEAGPTGCYRVILEFETLHDAQAAHKAICLLDGAADETPAIEFTRKLLRDESRDAVEIAGLLEQATDLVERADYLIEQLTDDDGVDVGVDDRLAEWAIARKAFNPAQLPLRASDKSRGVE